MIHHRYFLSFACFTLLAPCAHAGTPGTLASLSINLRQYTGDTLTGGLVSSKTVDLTGVTSTSLADGAGRTRQVVDGFGKTTSATYDANGNLLSRTDATGAGTTFVYDPLNRKLSDTDLAITGKVRAYTYDAANRLHTATDPLGIVTTYGYDLRDRKVSESTPMNGSATRLIRYGFDGRGHMTSLTDANGAVTTWTFDSAGRQTGKLYANGDHRAMAYDAAGRLVKLTDENGHDIVSTYDLAGRLVAKAYAADSTADTYAYDAASRITSATKGRFAHTLTYAYDPVGRLASETHPDGEVIRYAYDNANRLATLGVGNLASGLAGDAYAVGYAYDGRGLMASVTAGDYATAYAYRDNGQLAATVAARTATPLSDILRADRSYDAGARLLSVANTAITGEQAGVVYTLGADDQRLTATEETGQKWNYAYDGLKQLVTANKTDISAVTVPPLDQTYTYDPMGNRSAYSESGTAVAYTKNNANQYTGIVAAGAIALTQSPVYDPNGNMLSDGVKNYGWDAENQLVSVAPASPVSGDMKGEFAYDWRMRRIAKKTFVFTSGAWALQNTTRYKYREWNPIEETVADASGAITAVKRYVWGNDLSGTMDGAGGVGGLLSMSRLTSGTTVPDNFFYAYDGNGNVRALVKADAANPAVSAIVERYAYDGFGRELAGGTPLATSVNSFRFSTKQLDGETGMNYYGYRYYDAGNGRWINRDPIAEKGGLNVYAMVGNDLIYNYDILGQSAAARCLPIAAGIALGDGPLPIGDVIACGVIGGALIYDGITWACCRDAAPACPKEEEKPKRKRCKPCAPPVGTIAFRTDIVPPSRPHHPHPGTHTHLFEVIQSPVSAGCVCRWNKTGSIDGAMPPPGAVPEGTPVSGGGVEEY